MLIVFGYVMKLLFFYCYRYYYFCYFNVRLIIRYIDKVFDYIEGRLVGLLGYDFYFCFSYRL